LIDELRVEFGAGLNVLTGETGAGKSILIDALSLALGTKGEAEQIRTGAEEATVEAAFDLVGEEARRLLADSGIECLPDEFLVVRRLLLREGKSKAYLNGRLSSAALLRDLAELLIEVHGQHQGPGLIQPSRQRLLLDAYAGLTGDVAAFRVLYNGRQALREELGSLQAGEREKAQRIDLLRHQRGEIAAARLTDGEEEELNQERFNALLADHVIAGWEGVYLDEEHTEIAPCTLENKVQLLGDTLHRVNWIVDTATLLANDDTARREIERKNLSAGSNIGSTMRD
jgi:DNA repair protein RecN (Recombination protein N)